MSRPTRHKSPSSNRSLKTYSYKSKVCFTWYTGLSPSLAELSNSFYSLSKFFTLGMTMVDHASHTEGSCCHKSSAWYVCSVTTPVFIFVYQLIHSAINYQMEMKKVWAIPVSLATTPRIVVYFLFLEVLRCFSSPAYRSPALYIQTGAIRHSSNEVSPFGNLRFIA